MWGAVTGAIGSIGKAIGVEKVKDYAATKISNKLDKETKKSKSYSPSKFIREQLYPLGIKGEGIIGKWQHEYLEKELGYSKWNKALRNKSKDEMWRLWNEWYKRENSKNKGVTNDAIDTNKAKTVSSGNAEDALWDDVTHNHQGISPVSMIVIGAGIFLATKILT